MAPLQSQSTLFIANTQRTGTQHRPLRPRSNSPIPSRRAMLTTLNVRQPVREEEAERRTDEAASDDSDALPLAPAAHQTPGDDGHETARASSTPTDDDERLALRTAVQILTILLVAQILLILVSCALIVTSGGRLQDRLKAKEEQLTVCQGLHQTDLLRLTSKNAKLQRDVTHVNATNYKLASDCRFRLEFAAKNCSEGKSLSNCINTLRDML